MEEALVETFKLFNSDIEDNINIDISLGKENFGEINVNIEKDDLNLNFKINQCQGHAWIDHNPKELDLDDRFSDKPYKDDIFVLLLLKDLVDDYKNVENSQAASFYSLFDGKEIDFKDSITETNIYKKYKALKTFKDLQNEDNNYYRISDLITLDLLKSADLISVVKNGQSNCTLCDIFYEKYLEPFDNISYIYEVIKKRIDGVKPVDDNDIPNSLIFTDLGDGKARLVIDSENFDEEILEIPNKIIDKKGEIFQIEKISKLGYTFLKKS